MHHHRKIISGVGLAVLALFFLFFTIFLGLFPEMRIDLSEQKLYTLSDGAKKIVKEIEEPIHLQYFFSDKATRSLPEVRNYAKRVREMLENFVGNARGKLQLSVIDPEPFSEAEDKATGFGLQGIPINAAGEAIFHGLATTNRVDGQEVIPFFLPDKEELLEYQIASILYKLNYPKKPVLGVLTTLPLYGEMNPESRRLARPLSILDEFSTQFDVRYLDENLKAVDKDVDTLLVIQPTPLPSAALYAVDQFVMRGGKVLMFVDPFSEAKRREPPPQANPLERKNDDSMLKTLLASWGVLLDTDKVVADEPYALSIRLQGVETPVRHVAIMGYQKPNFNTQDPIIANLNNLHISTAGALRQIKEKKMQFTPLLHTSNRAMLMDKERLGIIQDPSVLMLDYKSTGEVYMLAARLDGDVYTAFPKGAPGLEDQIKVQPNGKHLEKSLSPLHAVIVADTDMLLDRMWIFYQDFFGQRIPMITANNGDFVVNALSNLSGSDALISIRGRGKFAHPFERVNALQAAAEREFKHKERELKKRLEETEFKLTELQKARENTEALILTPEQTQTLRAFLQDKINIRRELRAVQHGLNRSVERLGTTLKIINIGLMPLFVSVVALLVVWFRVRQRARVSK